MKPVFLCGWVVLIVFLFANSYPSVQAGFKPDQVKAAYIYNLPNFVSWPDFQETAGEDIFIIKVLGNRSIARYLEVLTQGEKIKGLPISIVYIDSIYQARNCKILFVDNSYEDAVTDGQLADLANNGILTVGESLDFLKKGGIVGLVPVDKRIVVVVNLSMAQRARISFSSKLMKVAKVFQHEQGEE